MPISQEVTAQIIQLLGIAQISQEKVKIERCAAGGNNRTYRVETSQGVFAAKSYFSHRSDARDRLGDEFSFLRYAEKATHGMVPKPYAKDSVNKLALYEFIEGQPLKPNEITETEVDAAIKFFCALNQPEARAHAFHLGNASEACFSIQEHFDLINARIRQVQQIIPDTIEKQTAQHYAKRLHHFWLHFIEDTKENASKEGIDLNSPLTLEQRCISPSDFGFHNALRTHDQSLRFLDFEYAGWDDPGKLAGDFFAQIAVPVPEKFFDQFIFSIMLVFPESDYLIRRAKILRVAYQVKWCCIALNVFLEQHLARRKFADESLDVNALYRAQLAKADHLMESLKNNNGHKYLWHITI